MILYYRNASYFLHKSRSYLFYLFRRPVVHLNCQLSYVNVRRLRVQDRITDVHGDICEIDGERTDFGIKTCMTENHRVSPDDGTLKISRQMISIIMVTAV